MVDPKVIDSVKAYLSSGRTEDEITAAMVNAGYNYSEIREAISAARSGAPVAIPQAQPAPPTQLPATAPMQTSVRAFDLVKYAVLASVASAILSIFIHFLVGFLSEGFLAGYLIWTRIPDSKRVHCMAGAALAGILTSLIMLSFTAVLVSYACPESQGCKSLADFFIAVLTGAGVYLIPISTVLALVGGALSPTIYKKPSQAATGA